MTTSTPKNISTDRPWLWIIGVFIVLIAFWSTVVTIAVRNVPQNVPLTSSPADAHH